MAELQEIELRERLFLKKYPFHRYCPRMTDPTTTAITPLKKPLSESIVTLITTAGLSLPGLDSFDTTMRQGDHSFHELPGNISPQLLEMNHRSRAFDQTGILKDRNLAIPLDRLHEMQARGEVGAVAPYHYSFMGSIVSPKKLIKQSAPEVARRLVSNGVDVAVLTPV